VRLILNRKRWKPDYIGKVGASGNHISRSINDQTGFPSSTAGTDKNTARYGHGEEALQILNDFPANRESSNAERLLPFAQTLVSYQLDSLPLENDLDIAFSNSIHLASSGKLAAALDGLLDILRQNKRYRNKLARKLFSAYWKSWVWIIRKQKHIGQN